MSLGAFSLVLHGHLPWVLHHGRWPHGEDWLFEAVSETWLPLLGVLDRCAERFLQPRWTVGLTPILLEQLAHERFRRGMDVFLQEQVERATEDQTEFHAAGEPHLAWLAERYRDHYAGQQQQLKVLEHDIAGAFARHAAAGRIGLLSSNATHGYHPLILHDRCAQAQIRAGLATSERHLGARLSGVWLPECAYRPAGPWDPIAVHGDRRDRAGVAQLLGQEGVRLTVVDARLIAGSRSEGIIQGGRVRRVDWDQATWDVGRAWRSPLEPVRVSEHGEATELVVLARAPEVSEQVWSADAGYPGDGRYLEFHKRHGMRGLKYWKVTSRSEGLGGKLAYHPPDAMDAAAEHAEHLAARVVDRLRAHREQHAGRYGVICAPFDAELFGHWWAEGPEFLWQLALQLSEHPEVDLLTAEQAVERAGVDKVVALPEGTWGAGGDHRVWLNDGLRFYWEIAYRAEDRFLDLWHRAPWRQQAAPGPRCQELLAEAGRQLLLLQASDWAFVISTEGAIDYGLRRIMAHAAAFDELCHGVEDALRGLPIDPVVRSTLERCKLVDPVFPNLDLEWWK